MLNMRVPKEITGAALVKRIEDYLFLEDSERGRKFFWAAKETANHLHNEKIPGWNGNNIQKVIDLALEFNIKVEIEG